MPMTSNKMIMLNPEYTLIVRAESTRYGFRHVAILNNRYGQEIDRTTAAYYNRTWEPYEFQTVAIKLLDKHPEISAEDRQKVFDRLSGRIVHEETISPIKHTTKKSGCKSGWKSQPLRHALAAKGIKTGRKK
jgi:hypothetical protein